MFYVSYVIIKYAKLFKNLYNFTCPFYFLLVWELFASLREEQRVKLSEIMVLKIVGYLDLREEYKNYIT
jgi:hypothetical protein